MADRPSRLGILSAVFSGMILTALGIGLLYLIFGGAFMTRFMPAGRPSTYDLVVGVLAWGFALAAPTAFLLMGMARFATGYRRWRAR